MRLDQVIVGERRREDMGDLDGLVASIRTYGLLHPIVLDAENRLVAGERRLRACAILGWEDIPARRLGTLSETERREIELEENLRRKDLTAYERSKTLADRADIAREVAGTEGRTESVRPSGQAWAARPDSYRAVSERIGVPVQTIRDAEQHVAAVAKYPELAPLNGSAEKTVKLAAALDALPDEDRAVAREKVRAVDLDTLSDLLGQPRIDYARTNQFKEQLAGQSRWASALTRLTTSATEIERAGGVEPLLAHWPADARARYAADLSAVIETLGRWVAALSSKEE
jgi:ParB-like chromosome segregation protein Spo0J